MEQVDTAEDTADVYTKVATKLKMDNTISMLFDKEERHPEPFAAMMLKRRKKC